MRSPSTCRTLPPLTPWTVQLLGDEPFEALRPTLEELLANKDKNKQRAAAEFLAGIITGMSTPAILGSGVLIELHRFETLANKLTDHFVEVVRSAYQDDLHSEEQ